MFIFPNVASIIGCITFLTNITVFVSLIICFFATSRATRFRDNVKSRFEADFKEGGQRNWVQIVCNLGVPHLAILLQLIGSGVSADGEIDFTRNYWNSWLTVSALGAVSCALGDTLSSELGPVLAEDTDPLLITTFRPVPKGTNGGVTIAGLFASVLGGLLIGAGAWITQAFSSSPPSTHWHSPQWPILFFCLYAGLLGSLVDSLLGATFQYTGYDHFRKRITQDPPTAENPGTFVEHISGRPVLDNHSVNLLSIALMALATPLLASHFWPDGVPY